MRGQVHDLLFLITGVFVCTDTAVTNSLSMFENIQKLLAWKGFTFIYTQIQS